MRVEKRKGCAGNCEGAVELLRLRGREEIAMNRLPVVRFDELELDTKAGTSSLPLLPCLVHIDAHEGDVGQVG
jgi:hypothetical protein